MRSRPKALARRLGGVVVTLLALGPAVIVAAPAAQASTASPDMVAAYQARVVYWINNQRAAYGRGGLSWAWCPQIFADNWAIYLASTGTFYHQSMYTILQCGGATVAAENLARGNVGASAIVAAWMASPGHRANILDGRLNRVGVHAVYAGGQWVVAADFTRQ
jgi:uncharacterized protein YkwD